MDARTTLTLNREMGDRVEIAITLENVSPEQGLWTVTDRARQAERGTR